MKTTTAVKARLDMSDRDANTEEEAWRTGGRGAAAEARAIRVGAPRGGRSPGGAHRYCDVRGETVPPATNGSVGAVPLVSCQIVPTWLVANARRPVLALRGSALK